MREELAGAVRLVLLIWCGATCTALAGGRESPSATPVADGTGSTVPIAAPEPVTADDSDRTVAVPRSAPAEPPARPAAPRGSREPGPAWDLLDSVSVWQLLQEDEHVAVEFDQSGALLTHAPSRPFTALAEQALDRAPDWTRKELEDSFARLDATLQDTLANLILDAEDPYVDEISWSVAHLSTTDLTHADFNPSLIVDNAHLLYKVDADVSYAAIVDYGDSIEGGDYYSTVRYRVKEDEEINEYEYPRDIYYWYIVHPRGSDELPTYIDPTVDETCTLLCYILDFTAPPPEGRFWREYFYGCDTDEDGTIDSPCPTYFDEQCDNDHDGTKDGPCPVLRDMLREVDVLWEMKKDVTGVENGAVGQASEWVHRMLGRWGDKDNCRPIQPVVVYYCQDGNCGEYQDMQTAAGRTALIPTIGVDAAPACDHVWNEFYERRWIEWQAEDEQIDHPEGHDGWKGGQAGVHAWRGDGLNWSDSTAQYTDHCELVVTITDADGYPVDGARVVVGSERSVDLCDSHDSAVEVVRGLTDAAGEVSFVIGDSNEPNCRRFYLQVHTDWARYPASGWTEVIHEPVGGTTYLWDHQFTEFTIPRLSMSPAADPSDPDVDNLMEITYSVTAAQGHGSGYHGGMHYREVFTPGDVDFFIADAANYSSYTAGAAFEAFESAEDTAAGDVSFVPPQPDDWYAVWANEAVMNFSQVVDTTISLYANNGYIPPVCDLRITKAAAGEAILDWEDLEGVNLDAYNVYRSSDPADVGNGRTRDQLAPFLLATVPDSTYTDADSPPSGASFFYSVRTLGRNGELADECHD
jgi:hypothetical protein